MLYLICNNFDVPSRDRKFDFYTPFHLSCNKRSGEFYYLAFSSDQNLIELKIDSKFKELIDLTIVSINEINFFDNKLDLNNIPNFQMSIAIYSNVVNSSYFTIEQKISLDVFENAILFYISDKREVAFSFYESGLLRVLTDKHFNIVAFVSLEISQDERNILVDYVEKNFLSINKTTTFKLLQEVYMDFDKFLFDKILQLKNINLLKFITYGYFNKMINNKFVIDFFVEYLNSDLGLQNKKEILEIMSLSNNEISRISTILNSFREVISVDETKKYNEVWFYLNSVNNLHKLALL